MGETLDDKLVINKVPASVAEVRRVLNIAREISKQSDARSKQPPGTRTQEGN